MQITDYLEQYQHMLDNTGTTAPTSKTEEKAAQSLVSKLTQLQTGSVFEGSINAIDGTKVLLGLSNGHTVSARLEGSMNLMLGQSVFFQVKSNDGNTIAIKPYSDEKIFNPTIQKALQAAGMEMTKDTLAMVNHMMEQGMPIDKNALASMYHTLLKNPQVPMQTAIAMAKLQIPVTNQMAAQFENYQNDRHTVLNQMEQVLDALTETYGKMSGKVSQLLQFQEQVLTVLDDGMPKQDVPLFQTMTGNSHAQMLSKAMLSEELQAVLQEQEAGSDPSKTGMNAEMKGTQENRAVDVQTAANEQADVQKMQGTKEAFTGDTIGKIGELLSKKQMAALEAQIKAVFPEAKDAKLNSQLTAKEFLDAVAKQLSEHQFPEERKAALAKLLSGKEYHTLLKDAVEQQWTVRPQQLKEGQKSAIDQLYDRLERQMGQLEQLAQKTGMSSNQLSQTASDLRNNIEFMHQVNQAYTYVQIPLKMAGQNAHSDLYVYTNKRNLNQKEGELSAFLHLDLENLGSTDVSVKMLDKKVSTKFYLADDASYDLIEKNLPLLQERLEKLGYQCKISVENCEKKVNFVEDFLQKGQPAKAASHGMVHRYSFDVRA